MALPHLEHEIIPEDIDDETLQDHVVLLDSDAVIPETRFDDPLSHHFNHDGREETPLSPTSAATIRDLSIRSTQATSLPNTSFSKSLSLLRRPPSAEEDPIITFKFTALKRPGTYISGSQNDANSASQPDCELSESHQLSASVTNPNENGQHADVASFRACATTLVPSPASQRSNSGGSDKPRQQRGGRPTPSLRYVRPKFGAVVEHRNEESFQQGGAPSGATDQSITLEDYDSPSNCTLSHKQSQRLPTNNNEPAMKECRDVVGCPTVATKPSQKEAAMQLYVTIPRTDNSKRKPRKPIEKTRHKRPQAAQDMASAQRLPPEGLRNLVQSQNIPADTSEDIIDIFHVPKSNVAIPQMIETAQHNPCVKFTSYPLDPQDSLKSIEEPNIPGSAEPSKHEIHTRQFVCHEDKKGRAGSMLDDGSVIEVGRPAGDSQALQDSEIPLGVRAQGQNSPECAADIIPEQSNQNSHPRAHAKYEVQHVKSRVSDNSRNASESPTYIVDDSMLHGVSSRGALGKVVTPNKKTKTPKPNSMSQNHPAAITQGGFASLPSVSDILQILSWTLQHEQGRAIQAEVEKGRSKDSEISQLKASERLMRGELLSAKKENEEISKKLKYQKEKLTGLQKYVNGLGSDLQKIRAESKAFYKECSNTLCEQLDEYEKDLATLRTEFSAAILQSKRIQDHTTEALSETCLQVQELHRSKDYLDQQLSEKVGLLVEERNLRSNLEKHLQASSADQSAIKKRLDENNQVLIEKLLELQSTMKQSEDKVKLQTTMDECIKVVRSLQSREAITPKDVKKAEIMLQHVLETMNSQFRKLINEIAGCHFPEESLKRGLNDKLKDLKGELLQNEELQAALAILRESNATLSERSSTQEQKVSELQEQLKTVKENESYLRSQVALLEAELIKLKSIPGPDEQGLSRLNDLQAENSGLLTELENVKAELVSSSNMLSTASISEQVLRDEISELKERIEDNEIRVKKAILEKNETEKHASDRIKEVRNKLNKDANRLRQEQQAEFENALHQANQQKIEKEKSLEAALRELAKLKQASQSVEKQLCTKDSEINRLEKEKSENETVLKKMQQSLREADAASKEIKTIKERLTTEVKASQTKSDEIIKFNAKQPASISKIENLQQSLDQAKANVTEYQEEIRRLREYSNSELLAKQSRSDEELRQAQDRITAAEDAKRELESTLDRYRKRAEAQIREIHNKSNGEKEELHRQFVEAEAEEKRLELEMQKIRTDAEDAIKQQQEGSRSELGELQRRLNESEALRHETEATIQRIRSDNEATFQNQNASEKRCADLEQRALRAESRLHSLKNDLGIHLNQESMQCFEQQEASSQNVSEGSQIIESPRTTAKAQQFKKPRKKVDRQSNSVVSMGTVPRNQLDPSQSGMDENQQNQIREVKEIYEGSDNHADCGENDIGLHEQLDEYGVSAVQPSVLSDEPAPESQLKSGPMMSFSQFNQSLDRASTPQHKRSSSILSDLETVSTPEEHGIRTTPTHTPHLAANCGLQKPSISSSTPRKVLIKPVCGPRGNQSTLGSLPPMDNSFFANIDRPKSQANTASRIAPSIHHSGSNFRTPGLGSSQFLGHRGQQFPSLSNGGENRRYETDDRHPTSRSHFSSRRETTMPLDDTSSPDYIHKDVSSFHIVTTYRNLSSRPASGTSQHAEPIIVESTPSSSIIKRRSSVTHGEGALGSKRPRETYFQAAEESRGHITKSTILETQSQQLRLKSSQSPSMCIKASQSQVQEVPIKASQSQIHPLSSIPSGSQSRIRSSTYESRVTSGRRGKPKKPTKNERYNLRFSQELKT